MALLGKIEEFDPKNEDWRQYLERLEEFFVANDLSGESEGKAVKRRATFISLIGPEPYKLLRSLLSPDKPKDKTFEELAAVLTKHYTPKPSEVVQSFRFFSRVRQHGETVADFVAELRRLAEDCNFGTALERMLRDRIVCGIMFVVHNAFFYFDFIEYNSNILFPFLQWINSCLSSQLLSHLWLYPNIGLHPSSIILECSSTWKC